MAKCRACDTYLTENMMACPECGLPRAIGTFKTIPTAKGKPKEDQQAVKTNTSVAYPIQERESDVVYSTPEERRVLTPQIYLISLILMMIPVIGIGIQIYWGYHYYGNYNRRNLARAFLVISSVFHIAAIVAILIIVRSK